MAGYEDLMGSPLDVKGMGNMPPATIDYDGHVLPSIPTNNAQALRARKKQKAPPQDNAN